MTRQVQTSRVGWFLRPTALVVAAYFVATFGIHGWLSFRAWNTTVENPLGEQTSAYNSMLVDQQPSQHLGPAEVVRIQLAGLTDVNRARGVLQCYAFASPANRLATGPLPRFAQMMAQPPYRELAGADSIVVGHPVLESDDTARVLVCALCDCQLHTFVWILSRQSIRELSGCWMTDSVLAVEQGALSEEPLDPGRDPLQTHET